jgi:hypothetical protein
MEVKHVSFKKKEIESLSTRKQISYMDRNHVCSEIIHNVNHEPNGKSIFKKNEDKKYFVWIDGEEEIESLGTQIQISCMDRILLCPEIKHLKIMNLIAIVFLKKRR